MRALLKKELSTLMVSPVGYVFLAAFFLIAGSYFYFTNLYYQTSELTSVFSSLYNISLYIIPVLTMRLFSEEKKGKTDVLLFTSPLSPAQIAVAKLLSSFLFYLLALGITFMYAISLSVLGAMNWSLFLCQFFGAVLLGLAFVAISGFFASFTENQIVAAISSIAALFIFHLSDNLISVTTNTTLQRVFTALSPLKNYYAFARGVVGLQNVVYFVSIAALFCYLTIFSIQKQAQG